MTTKYKLGDEVSISFMGMINEIKLADNKIFYKIDGGVGGPLAVMVKEDCIFPLPQPKDFEVQDGK